LKILLLPGLDGTGALFQQFLKLLPSNLPTQVCPLPAEGDQRPTHLAASIAATGLCNEDVIIIAESFSGRVAYELAQLHDHRIKGLILVSSFLTVPRLLLRLARWLPVRLFPWHWSPAWALRWFCVGPDASDELVQRLQQTIGSVATSTIADRIKVLSELDAPRENIPVPCLYLQPTDDRLVPKSHAEKIRKLCQNLKVEVIPGPHFLLQANPEACVAPVLAFIGLITRSGTGSSSADAPDDRCT
jgi:pimeloyl-ACP methyl ester carboxylesterase